MWWTDLSAQDHDLMPQRQHFGDEHAPAAGQKCSQATIRSVIK